PLPDPTPPPEPVPMPPPDPGPFDGGPIRASGSPYCDMFTCGSATSGGAMIEGSIVSFGFALATIAEGGVNCFSDTFGSRPLLAASPERSPPPPPPPIACFFGAIFGSYESTSVGTKICATVFTCCCTAFDENTVNSSATTADCSATDIAH